MVRSVRALMEGALDYAGLFPPAELSLGDAIAAYARQRASSEAWIQSRFICRVAVCANLAPYRETILAGGEPFRFSAIARGGSTAAVFAATFEEDLDALGAAVEAHGGRIVVDACEAKLPGELAAPGRVEAVAPWCDEAVCLLCPEDFRAVGEFYRDFRAVEDDEVLEILRGFAPGP